jgi:hypothetical protein
VVGSDARIASELSRVCKSVNLFQSVIEPSRIVQDKVYLERQQLTADNSVSKRRREYWWQYGALAKALYQTIRPLQRVLVCPIVTKYVSFGFVPSNWVYAHRVCVFAFETYDAFSILQSSMHEAWARKYSSTLETRINYSSSDVFETFPFPADLRGLETIGEQYHEYRRQIMLARQEGLTATYNRFHNPDEHSADIVRLRELHVEMDRAVAAAYGWDDINLGHGFHQTAQGIRYTISEDARREVLARLLKLNHERYEEEVRMGLHNKKAKGTLRKRKAEGKKGKETGSAGDKGKRTRKVKENGEGYAAQMFE